MRCPGCRSELVTVAHAGVNTYRCMACGGRAATMAVLRRFAPNERLNALWRDVWEKARAGYRKCPSCEMKMLWVMLEENGSSLELDACKSCQVVWFDSEELKRFSPGRQEVEDPDAKIPAEARRALAIAEVESMAEVQRLKAKDPMTVGGDHSIDVYDAADMAAMLLSIFV